MVNGRVALRDRVTLPEAIRKDIKMGLRGTPKEQRTQLFFRDDGKFIFRKLPIQDTAMVIKVNGIITTGWKHFFQLQFPFSGGKNIKADMVTLAYSRDIILDPFDIVPAAEKPIKGRGRLDKAWITGIAETQIYKERNKPHRTFLMDFVTGGLVVGLLIMILTIAYVAGNKGGG